ncbi:MAG: alpha/beta hydrolase [Gemmatimonadota bacterium]|nr:alpha/beta hydrolase [Gemmatimonadota bacterium]
MKRAAKFALGALGGAAAVVYGRAMVARNRALERPPMRKLNGQPYEIDAFELSDGSAVEYVDTGEGETLFWIPGADGPKETFLYQIPHFAKRYRVVSADLRTDIEPEHGLDRLVDDVVELLDHLGVERCVLIGQSLGSAIALRFAVRFPERLVGLVLSNPIARLSYDHVGLNRTALVPVAQATTRYLPTGLARVLARAVWNPLSVWIYDDSPGSEALIDYALDIGPRTTPPAVSNDRVELLRGHDLTEQLWQVDVPALVVKGPHDLYCPVSWALEIVDALPDARYVTIPGTGHCSHISRPGAFNQVLDTWLDVVLEEGPRRLPEAPTMAIETTAATEDIEADP